MVHYGDGKSMNAEELYTRLGRLIETAPDLYSDFSSNSSIRWMGQAYALALTAGQSLDAARLTTLADYITDGQTAYVKDFMTILYRAHAVAELNAPVSVQGSFISVGSVHDAHVAVAKVMSSARSSVMIVDPYMDDKVISDFVVLAAEGIKIQLLSDAKTVWVSFRPAVARFVTQYGASRPLGARLSPPRTLHDRLIVVDGTSAWDLSQSLKDLAVRSPASIARSGDIGALKIAAYQDFWDAASPV
jgi:hypothetical protein